MDENENTDEKNTARIEAFSEGVFSIALTLLTIDLKALVLEEDENY